MHDETTKPEPHRGSITYRWARRIAISVVGFTVLLAGIALIVLPGPAIVVIPAGLAILGLEYSWARRWLRTTRQRSLQLARSLHRAPKDANDG